jgi:hypothetical protein
MGHLYNPEPWKLKICQLNKLKSKTFKSPACHCICRINTWAASQSQTSTWGPPWSTLVNCRPAGAFQRKRGQKLFSRRDQGVDAQPGKRPWQWELEHSSMDWWRWVVFKNSSHVNPKLKTAVTYVTCRETNSVLNSDHALERWIGPYMTIPFFSSHHKWFLNVPDMGGPTWDLLHISPNDPVPNHPLKAKYAKPEGELISIKLLLSESVRPSSYRMSKLAVR